MNNFIEYANDPMRPLSLSPEQWSMRRGSIVSNNKQNDDNMIFAKENSDTTGLEKVDSGLDYIVRGITMMNEGFKELEKIELETSEKDIILKVRDLIDTAISPYTSDIIELLDKLEGEE